MDRHGDDQPAASGRHGEIVREREVSFLETDCVAALVELALLRGEWDEARAAIEHRFPDGPEVELGTPFYVRTLDLLRMAAESALVDGDWEQAEGWVATCETWLDWGARAPDRAAVRLLRARCRHAAGDLERARELAKELVGLKVDVIVAMLTLVGVGLAFLS